MVEAKKFEGILVYDDGPDIYARGQNSRVLFRFNRVDGSFAVFRSPRMTEDEKEFCLIMFKRLRTKRTLSSEEEILNALNYEIGEDLYCT